MFVHIFPPLMLYIVHWVVHQFSRQYLSQFEADVLECCFDIWPLSCRLDSN